MAAFYPPIDKATVKNLLIIKQLAKENENYFEDSPYSTDVESLVQSGTEGNRSGRSNNDKEDSDSGDSGINVLEEIKTTYKELNLHRPDMQDSAATMSYYRTRTSLLDKLLEQMERGQNQKAISEFYSYVVNFMEAECSPGQIAVFRERLKEFV